MRALPQLSPRGWIFLLGTMALLAAALGLVLRARDGDWRAAFKAETLASGALEESVSANGTLNPVILVNVGTQVSGTVLRLRADFNDRVSAGQVLLELDPALLRAQLHQSQAAESAAAAALALAQSNQRRAQPLLAQGYITQADEDQLQQALAAAQAQLRLARAQVEHDRTNLDYSVIRSPVAGVVVNRAVDVGQTVAANFQTPTLFQIAQDLKRMQIDSSFAEADVGRIRPGQHVRFTVDAFPDRVYAAQVQQVRLNPTTQQNVVTYDVVVAVDNADESLLPGMTAYVRVILDRRESVLRLPNAALRYVPPEGAPLLPALGQGDARVYRLAERGLQPVAVTTGISDGRYTELVSGPLSDGDRVVVGSAAAAAAATAGGGSMRLRVF